MKYRTLAGKEQIQKAIRRSPRRPKNVQAAPPAELITLHDQMGNRAVGQLIQAKLKIGVPDDKYEREADRVADQVMRMSEPHVDLEEEGEDELIQTKPLASQITPLVQRQVDGEGQATADTSSVEGVLRSPGRPLDEATRAFMESRFGYDFGGVRVHTGATAKSISNDLNAQAFTHGNNIYYGDGKFPGKNGLTAHELTHVVQQKGRRQSRIVQASPDSEKTNGGNTENETKALIKNAADVIERDRGKVKFYYLFADQDSLFLVFEDSYVQKLHRYIKNQWFGVSGFDERLDTTMNSAVPPRWVGEYRAKALNIRSSKPGDIDFNAYLEEKQLADLAVKLADSVAPETPAQKVRRQMVEEADKRIGTPIMSKGEINKVRNRKPSGGFTPQNFTTCIVFFSQAIRAVTNKLGIGSPLLRGPTTYKEINQSASESDRLPPGAWHPCTPNTRPKPGDLIIFMFADDVRDSSGKIKYGKGWFVHVSILRSIEPIQKTPSDKAPDSIGNKCNGTRRSIEKWISVDGGKEMVGVATRYFCPDNGLTWNQSEGARKVHGWSNYSAINRNRTNSEQVTNHKVRE